MKRFALNKQIVLSTRASVKKQYASKNSVLEASKKALLLKHVHRHHGFDANRTRNFTRKLNITVFVILLFSAPMRGSGSQT